MRIGGVDAVYTVGMRTCLFALLALEVHAEAAAVVEGGRANHGLIERLDLHVWD
jgi:hypothetical protein